MPDRECLKYVALLVCYEQNLRRGTPKGAAVGLLDIQVASSHEASASWSIRNLLSSPTCMLCAAGSISRVVSVEHLVYKTLCNAVQVLRKCSYSILKTSDRCLALKKIYYFVSLYHGRKFILWSIRYGGQTPALGSF